MEKYHLYFLATILIIAIMAPIMKDGFHINNHISFGIQAFIIVTGFGLGFKELIRMNRNNREN